jgi:hypothetical protein
MMEGQGGGMQAVDKAKVNHWAGGFPVPVFHPDTLRLMGYIPRGDLVEVLRTGLVDEGGWGLASAGDCGGDAEVIHPRLGQCLIEGAYLEVV